jgi:hypothetical protein
MAQVLTDRAAFLLSGQGTGVSAFGAPVDTRAAKNYGYLEYASYSPSALLILQASKDGTGWMNVQTVTATPSTGTAQVAGFYPYVRGAYATGWSTTASANLYYAPGIV